MSNLSGVKDPLDTDSKEEEEEEFTIASFHGALRKKTTTITKTITRYLTRISHSNHNLKALITINKHALDYARQKDAETIHHLTQGTPFPALHGVAVILKDTYATIDMPTTAGVQALRSLTTTSNAPVVQRLLAAGAIILAKANLHELSLEGVTISSLGGQTLNPYDRSRTPGGSSGGTAAALAADYGLVGCGGDTVNSLRSPASACSIVGFRPTKGVIEKEGVVPVSRTQDVVGPMGRCVRDVRVLFDIMRGGQTTSSSPEPNTHSTKKELRIGVIDSYFGNVDTSEGKTINQTVLSALDKVQSSVVATTPIHLVHLPLDITRGWDIPTLRAQVDVQSFEFQSSLDRFLQSPLIASTPHTSLSSIANSGEYHHKAITPVFFETQSPDFTTSSPEYQRRLDKIESLKESVAQCFEAFNLDAVAYPHQKQFVVKVGSMVQPGRNGILASLTGRPAICVPAGFSEPSDSAPVGVPIGLELMGSPGEDERLLDMAEMFEGVIRGRRRPEVTW